MFHTRMGHPEEDSDLLDEVSPVNHAGKIVRPLLIGQGKNDPVRFLQHWDASWCLTCFPLAFVFSV